MRPGWKGNRGEGIYNVIVIGAGTAGLVTAAGTAGLGGRVALVERGRMGGDCLNYGCVPSKALIKSARVAAVIKSADRYGLESCKEAVDYGRVVRWMKAARARIEPHDSVERFEALGVDVFLGEARFESPHAVRVGNTVLKGRHVVLATGGRAAIPSIPGLKEARYFTNETFFENEIFPARLAVLGAGPIGCELSQTLARLGSTVTLIDHGSQVLHREDEDAAGLLHTALGADGVNVLLGTDVTRVEKAEGGASRLMLAGGGADETIDVDAILVGAGRLPNVEGLDLDKAGVAYGPRGVRVDRHLRTTHANIYAAGDVAGSYQFTHLAEHQARTIIRNLLIPGVLGFLRARADRFVLPWATFTEPEVARVGLNEKDAMSAGVPFDVYRYDYADLDRAIVDAAGRGFVKVLTQKGKDRILGATLVGEGAGEMVHELVIAMRHRIGLGSLSSMIHIYPTLSQAVQRVGDAYQRTRLTDRARQVLGWIYTWQRRGFGKPI